MSSISRSEGGTRHDERVAHKHWFALEVRPRFESSTARVLQNKGCTAWAPLYRVRHKWSDRMKEIRLPMFPGYVFCHFDPNDQLIPILGTPGVTRIVRFGNKPEPVADSEIAALQVIEASGLQAEPWPHLETGSTVEITRGPLAGISGILIEFRKSQRVVVSVSLLQRSVAVEVDQAWIAPIDAGMMSFTSQNAASQFLDIPEIMPRSF